MWFFPLILLESDGTFYLIDIWNMKTHKINFEEHLNYRDCFTTVNSEVIILDEDSKLLSYEFSGLKNKTFFEYDLYVDCPLEMLEIIKSHRQLQVQTGFLPVREFDTPTDQDNRELRYYKDLPLKIVQLKDLFVVVYKKRMIVYLSKEHIIIDKMKNFEQMSKIRTSYKYVIVELDIPSEIFQAFQFDGKGICAFTKTSGAYFVSIEDLKLLFRMTKWKKKVNIISENNKLDKLNKESVLYVNTIPIKMNIPGGIQVDSKSTTIMPYGRYLIVHKAEDNTIHWFELAPEAKGKRLNVFTMQENHELVFEKQSQSIDLVESPEDFCTFFEKKDKKFYDVVYESFNYQVKKDLKPEHLKELFREIVEEDDVVSYSISGSLSDKQLYYILATKTGKLVLIPMFISARDHVLQMFYTDLEMNGVSNLEIINGNLLCCSDDGELCIINFNSNSLDYNNVEYKEVKADDSEGSEKYRMKLKQISDNQIDLTELYSKVTKIMPVVVTGRNKNGNHAIQNFFLTAIGLVLHTNRVVILQLSTKLSLFEHSFSEKEVVGLFFDSIHEFLFILYDDGELEIFNTNLGNIIAMMKTRNEILRLNGSSGLERSNKDVLFQLQFFMTECFTYERSVHVKDHPLNLKDLLEQYKSCYIDLKSYSKFCGSALMNHTVAGQVAEYSTQFYHNPLLSTHIELISFSNALRMKRPHSLKPKKKEASGGSNLFNSPRKKKEKKMALRANDLSQFTSLNDLSKAIEQSNESERAAEGADRFGEREDLDHQKIHMKIQNVVERDRFALARELLGEKPIKLLKNFEVDDGEHVRIDNVEELIQLISILNYSGKQILIDCESLSCNQILKLRINDRSYNAMLVSPPNYDPNIKDRKLILTCLVFPFGLDKKSDSEISKAFGDHHLILDITPGIAGIGDSISFKLNHHFINFKKKKEPVTKENSKLLNLELYKISPFQSSNYMLGVVCEVIYLFKLGFIKVQSLINALKKVYFRELPNVDSFKNFSFKILSMLALNDRLLISAGAHFIINNIYAQVKDSQLFTIDRKTIEFCSYFFLTAQESNRANQNSQELHSSPLSMISKFELFATSILLVELRNKNSTFIPNEKLVSFSHSVIIRLISKSIE